MNPKLSVLIPCVPSRHDRMGEVFTALERQAHGFPVEILALVDNKQRSIGAKRDALVQIARGDYLAFVDDDDGIFPKYVENILRGIECTPDVIVFDTLVSLNDGPDVIAQHSLAYNNEQYSPAGFKRKPWQMHAWRREIAQAFQFPDLNIGEDWGWCKQLCEVAKTEVKVEGPLYWYRYSDSGTEARS